MKNIITFKNLLHIIISSIDYMDGALAGHCTRVAYDIMSILKNDPRFTYEEVCKITWTTLFHDIGILQKTPIKDLIAGEEKSSFSHAEYGSLFMKYFSPFPEYYIIVKYHHTSYEELLNVDIDEKLEDVITLIYIIDQIDLYRYSNEQPNIEKLTKGYKIEIVDAIKKYISIEHELSNHEMQESLLSYLGNMKLTDEYIFAFLNILVSSFDFRSRHTAIHCATVSAISDCLANIYNLDEKTSKNIRLGAMLHDIGKIAIPHRILESPDKLNENDWKIMQSHITITEKILKNRVTDEVLKIASCHHEKLDGTGYPYGIYAKDLTLPERIVAVSDVISALVQERSYKKAFSLEKVCEILREMAQNEKLCPYVCETFLSNKEEIYQYVKEFYLDKNRQYEQIMNDYNQFMELKKLII